MDDSAPLDCGNETGGDPAFANVADQDKVEGAEWHAAIDGCGAVRARSSRRGSANELPDRLYKV